MSSKTLSCSRFGRAYLFPTLCSDWVNDLEPRCELHLHASRYSNKGSYCQKKQSQLPSKVDSNTQTAQYPILLQACYTKWEVLMYYAVSTNNLEVRRLWQLEIDGFWWKIDLKTIRGWKTKWSLEIEISVVIAYPIQLRTPKSFTEWLTIMFWRSMSEGRNCWKIWLPSNFSFFFYKFRK